MLCFKGIRDNVGDEYIVVFEQGKFNTPIAIFDWIAIRDMIKELQDTNLLDKVAYHSPKLRIISTKRRF